MNDIWNFFVWQAFAKQLYRESILLEHLTDDGVPLFFESVMEITKDMKLLPKNLPIEHRTVVYASKGNQKYIIPAGFTEHFPFKIKKSFKCQIKQSDKRVWEFVTEIEAQEITPQKRFDTYREYVNQWNPHRNADEKAKLFLAMLAHASLNKGTKVCICSPPGAGKNAPFTLCGIATNVVVRLAKPSLAMFFTSLYYNDVIVMDEVTSMAASDISELEPVILGLADNSPEILKNKMAKNKDMQKMPLIKKSIIFPYNRPEDLEGKTFFDEKWNNIGAFRKRFPQFLIGGEVLDSPKALNEEQAMELASINKKEIAAQIKELLYWTQHLHEHVHGYDRTILNAALLPRHISNLQGLIDTIDVYCKDQAEFDEWQVYLLNCLTAYKQMISSATPKQDVLKPDTDDKGNHKLNVDFL